MIQKTYLKNASREPCIFIICFCPKDGTSRSKTVGDRFKKNLSVKNKIGHYNDQVFITKKIGYRYEYVLLIVNTQNNIPRESFNFDYLQFLS